MLARAALAAALALLVSGDVARLGWGALAPGRLIFPYLWLFLLLEAARVRRRVGDGEVFLAGAAAAMLHAGVYAKDLQHGFHPLGVDWPGAVSACFDGGMTAVLALHGAVRLRPRREPAPESAGLLLPVFLVFVLGAAACVYGIRTAFGFYRADRLLGDTWLFGDLLFAGLAWALFRRASEHSWEGEAPERENWVWALSAFVVWLPAARLVARVCALFELPDPLLYFFVGAWTVAAGVLFWRLWRERAHAALVEPRELSRPAAVAALWRAAGSLILAAALGAGLADPRAGAMFSAFVDLPTYALFAWAFLATRLKV